MLRKTSEYSIHITETPTHYKTYTHARAHTLHLVGGNQLINGCVNTTV
jgi:hypothetical protein